MLEAERDLYLCDGLRSRAVKGGNWGLLVEVGVEERGPVSKVPVQLDPCPLPLWEVKRRVPKSLCLNNFS